MIQQEINLVKELKPLSRKDIYKLINNPFDVDLWLQTLPIENFEFSGFLRLDFADVTQLEVISSSTTPPEGCGAGGSGWGAGFAARA